MNAVNLAVRPIANVDLTSGWNSLLSAIQGATGNLLGVLAMVGVAMIVIAILVWAYQRRKGGVSGFPWMMVVLGAALASPAAVIPLLLTILEFIVNFFIGLFSGFNLG